MDLRTWAGWTRTILAGGNLEQIELNIFRDEEYTLYTADPFTQSHTHTHIHTHNGTHADTIAHTPSHTHLATLPCTQVSLTNTLSHYLSRIINSHKHSNTSKTSPRKHS